MLRTPHQKNKLPTANCYGDSYKISYCSEYPNVAPRKATCRELNLYILCSCARHKSESCLGNFNKLPSQCDQCKTNRHVTPLCENKTKKDNPATFSTVYINLILPDTPYNLAIVSVTITKVKENPKFNCSFETGSQRSYFSKRDINKLGCYESDPVPVEFKIKTCQDFKVKKSNQITLEIEVNKEKKFPLPVLVNDDFDIKFQFDDYKNVFTPPERRKKTN